ncbi:MAG: ABC transporter permease [Oscillospiraceae bacterium]|nr:ABC transporter permease [Oscillospiraceae bacterium]
MFFKECKKAVFSITFLLYVFVVFAMYTSQFDSDTSVPEPAPSASSEDYGYTDKLIPETLMPNAINGLVDEYLSGDFITYPMGFYKRVVLTEKKKTALTEIITELTGLTAEELDGFDDYVPEGFGYVTDENGEISITHQERVIPEITIPESLTYERFRELMNEADKIIGGGSYYGERGISRYYSRVPKTYEDALADYNHIIYDEKVTGAYARLFCDYAGIDLAVMPVFVAAALVSLDRKSRMSDLIYSRKISSLRLVFTRFAALVTVMLIPAAVTVVMANISVSSRYPNFTVDLLAIPKLAAVWLIPNVLLAAAMGMFVTELSSPILAVFVQGAWWMKSVMSADNLTGEIAPFTLVCRHNSLYKYEAFENTLPQFIFNRTFFTVLSLVLVGLTAVIYELKRRGIWNGLFSSGKNSFRKSSV